MQAYLKSLNKVLKLNSGADVIQVGSVFARADFARADVL